MKLTFRIQKGTLPAVVREVSRTYVILREKYPDFGEHRLSRLVWDRWLPINRERIWQDESETRYLRFEEVCDRRAKREDGDNIFTVFFDILYIETGTEPSEKTRFREAAKALYRAAKELGLDFKNELRQELENARRYRKDLKRGSR